MFILRVLCALLLTGVNAVHIADHLDLVSVCERTKNIKDMLLYIGDRV